MTCILLPLRCRLPLISSLTSLPTVPNSIWDINPCKLDALLSSSHQHTGMLTWRMLFQADAHQQISHIRQDEHSKVFPLCTTTHFRYVVLYLLCAPSPACPQ